MMRASDQVQWIAAQCEIRRIAMLRWMAEESIVFRACQSLVTAPWRLLIASVILCVSTTLQAQSGTESAGPRVVGPAEGPFTRTSATESGAWNLHAGPMSASSDVAIQAAKGEEGNGWAHAWLRAVD